MKVYVAASSRNLERAEKIMNLCRDAGLVVTSTWVEKIRNAGTANLGMTYEQRLEASTGCLREVLQADAVLLDAPPPGVGIGAHWECGAAVIAGKHLVVVNGGDRSVFFALANREYDNVYAAVEYLKGLQENPGISVPARQAFALFAPETE